MNLSKKAKDIAPSITLEITAKAKSLKESGVDVISFGAGEPDFNTPKNIIDAAYKAMLDGKTKYTQTSGILELREAICKKFKEDNSLEYKVDQILVSTGAKQSLANVFLAILNPEDEVMMATPYWVSYPELIKLADGKPVFLNTSKDNGYKLNIAELEKALTSKSKAFIINSPNNPTGTIYTKEELYDLANFAEENNLIIISDEIYEKLIYDNERHISIASLSSYAYKNTIVINGFSKSSAMTGWRIGYAAANKEIIKLMTGIQSHTTSNTCSVTQYAALEALNGPKDELLKMVKAFEERKNFMVKLLKGLKDIDIIEPKGAFYVMVDITKYLNDDIKDSLEFSKELLEKEKVAVIPGIGFGLEGYIRLSYAISKEQIEEGIERIKNFLNIIK